MARPARGTSDSRSIPTVRDSPELRCRVAAIVKELSNQAWAPLHFLDLDDEEAAEIAAIAVRRWRSFPRRASGPRANQVHDLARGLRSALRSDPAFEEPTDRHDWIQVAEWIAPALRES